MSNNETDLQLIAKDQYTQAPRFMHMKQLPINVVEAAKARIRWMIKEYDEVVVAFSGGKDSLVVLTLVDMVYKELGITKKVKVKFMDEELVSDEIIDFVYQVAESGRFDFGWYCLNMYVGFYVMGKHKPFVTWQKERPWHRQPPDRDYVIYDIGVDTTACNENSISQYMYNDEFSRNQTCVELTGIRADESMKRFFSVTRWASQDFPNYISPVVENKLYT
jgi:predicted phosphoadenosine phosphosulfate sulfurtransferase